ncbi:uncharacterized protein L201_007454 [Kwoniella dendrophila CBS 6074]|uniref:Carbohydrate kinase PfkB domain-containing protein n=1 Tax=Kwoniella dendrophila CBS 6074 TaxID=1295534 RepID=A0AAX4K6R2_9TREE
MDQSKAGPQSPPLALPPILASIGTVLIDAFDSPPRPTVDSFPKSNPGIGLPSPPVDGNANEPNPDTSPAFQPNIVNRPLPVPSHLATPIASPAPSTGPSTPQLSLDDHPTPDAEEVYEMLGGGALYALVGARLWLSPSQIRTLVNRAPDNQHDDLPSEAEDKLNSLGKEIWVWNEGEGTKMTRARIRYEGDVRFFQPIVKAPHRTITQLVETPLYGSEYLHISPPYSPEDVSNLLDQLKSLKQLHPESTWDPKIVFEPTPPSCHPGQKEWLEKIAPHIEVLSPNHEEMFSIYGISPKDVSDIELRPTVEKLINHFLQGIGIGKEGKGIIIIRCGKLGACVGTKDGGLKWCPAYFTEDQDKVKDVTGAGNSFLGGYVAGLHLSDHDPYEALLYATISASFVVEQFGLPSLSITDGNERWNGDIPKERVEALRKRIIT